MPHDDATLLDIARAARLVVRFARGMDRDEFLDDTRTQSAVLHQLMVMGEAVKRLSSEFRDAHPGIPWALIAVMRDKLIHSYDEVDLGLTADDALVECDRCFSCGKCFGCENCWMYCQVNVFAPVTPPTHGNFYTIKKLEVCDGCKKCWEECPCGYIVGM